MRSPRLRKQFRAVRSHAFEVHQFGCGRHGHYLFISRTRSIDFSLWVSINEPRRHAPAKHRCDPHRLKPVLQGGDRTACNRPRHGKRWFASAPSEACLPLERLDRNDAKVLLLWILAGLLGAGVAYNYFFQAFPEASVDFKVPRADALVHRQAIRRRAGRAARRLRFEHRFRCGRHGENIPRARSRPRSKPTR